MRLLEAGASSAKGRPLGVANASALRTRLRLAAGRFTTLLVGKDGHVAMRSHAPVVAGMLFPTIHAMPMRREEVARKRVAHHRSHCRRDYGPPFVAPPFEPGAVPPCCGAPCTGPALFADVGAASSPTCRIITSVGSRKVRW